MNTLKNMIESIFFSFIILGVTILFMIIAIQFNGVLYKLFEVFIFAILPLLTMLYLLLHTEK